MWWEPLARSSRCMSCEIPPRGEAPVLESGESTSLGPGVQEKGEGDIQDGGVHAFLRDDGVRAAPVLSEATPPCREECREADAPGGAGASTGPGGPVQ